jgi:hypothetical protein
MGKVGVIKRAAKEILRNAGFELRRVDVARETSEELMHSRYPTQKGDGSLVLHRYLKQDGSFDYEGYKRVQTEANHIKLDYVWARQENIVFLSDYIRRTIGQPSFGLCHGTRRGKEQEWFRENLQCEIIGTDISDTAEMFPHTIRWDFHEAKPEWLESADFIYSNSLDHSYDPEKCLNVWMSCVRRGGLCVIEHSSGDEEYSEIDPFAAGIEIMPYLVLKWGKGNYGIRELIQAPSSGSCMSYLYFIVIQKF